MLRKRNWQEYNKQLIQRGSITFLLDPKICKTKKQKTMGRPLLFTDALITMLMMIKIHYHMPYRCLQGFAESIVKLAKYSFLIPSYSLICKRARKIKSPKLTSSKPSVVAIDASGVKVYGEGEWKVKIHGKSKRRKWIKIHIAVDPNTGEIVAQKITTSDVHDGKVVGALLDQIPPPKQILADGAYDGKNVRSEIASRGAQALIPPPRNARLRNKDPSRDDAIRLIRGFGNDQAARTLWGKLTGYSKRALVESAFSRMKRLFGSRLFSKRLDSQEVENYLRCLILNKMNALSV